MNKHRWDVTLTNALTSFGLAFLPVVLSIGWKSAAVAGGLAVCTNLAGLYQVRPNSPLRGRKSGEDKIPTRILR